MKADVQVAGLVQLRRTFRRVGDRRVASAMRSAHKATAAIVEPRATSEAPRGPTGRLAESVAARSTTTQGVVRAGTRVRVRYAPVIHWGWPARNIEPNEFLHRALEATPRAAVEQAFYRELRAAFRPLGGLR